MKKYLLLIILVFLVFFSGCSKNGLVLPIDETKIDEAIKYGVDNSSLTNTEFVTPWTSSSGNYVKGDGVATILTPFLRVALLSKRCTLTKSVLDKKIIKSLVNKEIDFFNFEVTLYGDEYSFARNVDYLLIYKDKEYEPSAHFMPSYSDMGRDYTCIAQGWVKFEKKDIPDDADIRLVVKFKVNEMADEIIKLNFDFNLKEIK